MSRSKRRDYRRSGVSVCEGCGEKIEAVIDKDTQKLKKKCKCKDEIK